MRENDGGALERALRSDAGDQASGVGRRSEGAGRDAAALDVAGRLVEQGAEAAQARSSVRSHSQIFRQRWKAMRIRSSELQEAPRFAPPAKN